MSKYIIILLTFVVLGKHWNTKGISLIIIMSFCLDVLLGHILTGSYQWLYAEALMITDTIMFFIVISLLQQPSYKLLMIIACIVYTMSGFFFSYPYLFSDLFPFLEYGYFLFFELLVMVLIWIERTKSLRYTIMISIIIYAYVSPFLL